MVLRDSDARTYGLAFKGFLATRRIIEHGVEDQHEVTL
jgi:hypothetical protein